MSGKRLHLLQKIEDAHEDSLWTVSWNGRDSSAGATGDGGHGQLLTGSVDEQVKVWKEKGEEEVEHAHTLTGVSLGAVSVAVDSLGKYGAVNSLDSKIHLWNMADFSLVGDVLAMGPTEAWDIAFCPRETEEDPLVLAIAGGSGNCVRMWDLVDRKEIANMPMPEKEGAARRDKFTLSVATSPDGKYVAAAGMDGQIAVFDAKTKELVSVSGSHLKPIRSLTFTSNSRLVISASDDTQIGIHEVSGGQTLEMLSGHESWVLSVAMHPEGNLFASGSSDGKVKLWDLETRKCIQTSSEHTDQVWGVAWSADGKRLASVSDDRAICIYTCV